MNDNDFLQLVFDSLQGEGDSDAMREAVLRQLIESELAARNEARREHGGEPEETAADYLNRLHQQRMHAIQVQGTARAAQRSQRSNANEGAIQRQLGTDQAAPGAYELGQQRMQATQRELDAQALRASIGLLNRTMSVGDALGRMPSQMPVLPGLSPRRA